MAKTEKTIVQIIPSPQGMSAVYAGSDGKPIASPLVCLALIQNGDGTASRYVVGLDADHAIEIAESAPNFIGYLIQGESIDEWQSRAREHAEKKQQVADALERRRQAVLDRIADDPGRRSPAVAFLGALVDAGQTRLGVEFDKATVTFSCSGREVSIGFPRTARKSSFLYQAEIKDAARRAFPDHMEVRMHELAETD